MRRSYIEIIYRFIKPKEKAKMFIKNSIEIREGWPLTAVDVSTRAEYHLQILYINFLLILSYNSLECRTKLLPHQICSAHINDMAVCMMQQMKILIHFAHVHRSDPLRFNDGCRMSSPIIPNCLLSFSLSRCQITVSPDETSKMAKASEHVRLCCSVAVSSQQEGRGFKSKLQQAFRVE